MQRKKRNVTEIFAGGGSIKTGHSGGGYWDNTPHTDLTDTADSDGSLLPTKTGGLSTGAKIGNGVAAAAPLLQAGISAIDTGRHTGGRVSIGAQTGSGAVQGAALGTSVLPGWGTLIGAVVGAGYGLIKGSSDNRKAKREINSQSRRVQQEYALNEFQPNLDMYGNRYEDGGSTGNGDVEDIPYEEVPQQQAPAPKKLINVEKDEIMINPMDMTVVQEFTNPNRFASHKKNQFMEPHGNFVTLPEGHVIIPKSLAPRFKKGDILTRKSIVMDILSKQAKDPYFNTPEEAKPNDAEQYARGGNIQMDVNTGQYYGRTLGGANGSIVAAPIMDNPGKRRKRNTKTIVNNYGMYNGVVDANGVSIDNPTIDQSISTMVDYMKNNNPDSNVYRPEFQHNSITMGLKEKAGITTPVMYAADGGLTGKGRMGRKFKTKVKITTPIQENATANGFVGPVGGSFYNYKTYPQPLGPQNVDVTTDMGGTQHTRIPLTNVQPVPQLNLNDSPKGILNLAPEVKNSIDAENSDKFGNFTSSSADGQSDNPADGQPDNPAVGAGKGQRRSFNFGKAGRIIAQNAPILSQMMNNNAGDPYLRANPNIGYTDAISLAGQLPEDVSIAGTLAANDRSFLLASKAIDNNDTPAARAEKSQLLAEKFAGDNAAYQGRELQRNQLRSTKLQTLLGLKERQGADWQQDRRYLTTELRMDKAARENNQAAAEVNLAQNYMQNQNDNERIKVLNSMTHSIDIDPLAQEIMKEDPGYGAFIFSYMNSGKGDYLQARNEYLAGKANKTKTTIYDKTVANGKGETRTTGTKKEINR